MPRLAVEAKVRMAMRDDAALGSCAHLEMHSALHYLKLHLQGSVRTFFFLFLMRQPCRCHDWGFQGGSGVRRLATIGETRVRSLDREDLLEKEMATHSSIHAWESGGQRTLVDYNPWGRKRVR